MILSDFVKITLKEMFELQNSVICKRKRRSVVCRQETRMVSAVVVNEFTACYGLCELGITKIKRGGVNEVRWP